jgi:hypothetical protein
LASVARLALVLDAVDIGPQGIEAPASPALGLRAALRAVLGRLCPSPPGDHRASGQGPGQRIEATEPPTNGRINCPVTAATANRGLLGAAL